MVSSYSRLAVVSEAAEHLLFTTETYTEYEVQIAFQGSPYVWRSDIPMNTSAAWSQSQVYWEERSMDGHLGCRSEAGQPPVSRIYTILEVSCG